jgi:hypothetical protein
MDHNEHVINGPLRKELADKKGLDLHEAIVQHTGTSPAAIFFPWLKADQWDVGVKQPRDQQCLHDAIRLQNRRPPHLYP